jgi:hypothetical protein
MAEAQEVETMEEDKAHQESLLKNDELQMGIEVLDDDF